MCLKWSWVVIKIKTEAHISFLEKKKTWMIIDFSDLEISSLIRRVTFLCIIILFIYETTFCIFLFWENEQIFFCLHKSIIVSMLYHWYCINVIAKEHNLYPWSSFTKIMSKTSMVETLYLLKFLFPAILFPIFNTIKVSIFHFVFTEV